MLKTKFLALSVNPIKSYEKIFEHPLEYHFVSDQKILMNFKEFYLTLYKFI